MRIESDGHTRKNSMKINPHNLFCCHYKSKKEISEGTVNFKMLKIEKLVMSKKKQNLPVLRLPSAIEQQSKFISYLKMVKLHI